MKTWHALFNDGGRTVETPAADFPDLAAAEGMPTYLMQSTMQLDGDLLTAIDQGFLEHPLFPAWFERVSAAHYASVNKACTSLRLTERFLTLWSKVTGGISSGFGAFSGVYAYVQETEIPWYTFVSIGLGALFWLAKRIARWYVKRQINQPSSEQLAANEAYA